ncbi:MAG: S9 family peptidase [Woeseiaceae bacterium]
MQTPVKLLTGLISLFTLHAFAADPEARTANDGNLVMQDVPPIPGEIVADLNRYQNVRFAAFREWAEGGKSVYISTRFGDVNQIHRVDMPGGARHQVTFYDEPVGGVERQPGGNNIIFTRDAGGSEFSQIFLLDPIDGATKMLTDGESRNGGATWDRDGRRIAYSSTRRNGASNDVWMMDVDDSSTARVVLEAPNEYYWDATEFSGSGSKVLISNYVSIADSRVNLLDLDTGEITLLAGGPTQPSANFPVAFDDAGDGVWYITDQGSDFRQLAWQSLAPGSTPEIITAGIRWDVGGAQISNDRRRIAFTSNENGMSRVYLLDTATREYASVAGIPLGLVFGMRFSPDDRQLAMTLNSATAPSDVFVLDLDDEALQYGQLERWTTSEVGGLDTTQFRAPELVSFPTFDEVDGKPREIPAWVYTPPGDGPFPVIVSIHGGPEGQTRPGFSSTYQMWMDKLGAAVVLPNVRGSAGYGKQYLALDNNFKREDSVRDIGALLDWIETREDLDANRVAVFGASYGGYMVLASSFHYSDRLKAAVDVVGISNFITFLENTQDYRRNARRAEYGDERDPAMRAHFEKIAPMNNVHRITIPMLIVQGENDPRVPVTESAQVVAALREQGQSVWYMNALNEGHGYRKKENRDIYQQATVLFFREHLVGDER